MLFTAWTVAVLLAVLARTGHAACVPPLDSCADDFNCYQARITQDTPDFSPLTVSVADQFETATVSVRAQEELCAPANKDDEGILDPATHLMAYRIRSQNPRHVRRSHIRLTNQLEEIRVSTLRPSLILVPTAKSLTQPGPPPPNSGDHNVDHFKCYQVRVTPGTPLPAQNRKVDVSDQFTEPAKIINLRRPRHLCVPVDKNGEGIKNPAAHLLCYRSGPARGEPKHLPREGLFVANQFGALRINTARERAFCIPSVKSLSPSGAFLENDDSFL
jgi:hypothetical protein